MHQRAGSVQRNASFHSRASQRCRLPTGGDPGESSASPLRSKQIRAGQPRRAGNNRYVRCALAALATIELQNSRVVSSTWFQNALVKLGAAAKLGLPHWEFACRWLIYFL